MRFSTTLLLVAVCAVALTALSQPRSVPIDDVPEGALLFVLPDEPNAITQATGVADHVGIAHHIGGYGGPLYVVEAVGRGVCLTAADSFVVHNAHARLVVRQVPGLAVEPSVRRALQLVGRPYDHNFEPGDSAIYCSELVQLCYTDSAGRPIFSTIAMNFADANGNVLPYWYDHYGRQHRPVPQGAPGTNPSQLLQQLDDSH